MMSQRNAVRRIASLVKHFPSDAPGLVACRTEAFAVPYSVSRATHASLWEPVALAPADPILGITDAFNKDTSPDKINLGVGAYRTEEGKPLVLDVVRKAEMSIVTDLARNKEYKPIGGEASFCKLSAKLAFGDDSKAIAEGRVATVQCLSGTGSLRVGAEFISRQVGVRPIYLPEPTWANHKKIFPLGGLPIASYRYFDAKTCGLDFDGLVEDISKAPDGAVVLLHACAHNPTGVDPTMDQWSVILELVKSKNLIPFFDSAYQGFASGSLDRDAEAIRMFVDAGVELLLAQSYAKNLGLYGERVGALSVVCNDAEAAKRVESQLKMTIRPMYSSPPGHGATIVAEILSKPELFSQWKDELAGMAGRIAKMRDELYAALKAEGAPGDWTHIINQIGMFSYTGLNTAQVKNMTEKWHVYMTMDGRISMAGLSSSKCTYLARAIKDSVTNC